MRSSNISKALRTSSAGETTAAVMRGWKSSVHRSPITPISEKSRGTRTWAPSSAGNVIVRAQQDGGTWSTAQIGVQPTGLRPYFINSIMMVVPAVAASTLLGALNGYVLTKWRFRGDNFVFTLMLLSCFIPFQIVLIPMAKVLGLLHLAGTTWGLALVHAVYGIGFTTLFFRNYYEAFPTELIKAAQVDGASFFQIFRRIMLPSSGPIIVVTVIWQFTNIWNDFLFGVSFADVTSLPMTVALNNLVSSSTGVKEYNVHFAGAILAALPTLIVYVVSGRYFVRGLMAGAVKG